MLIRLAQRDLQTKFGTFTEILYYDGRAESVALVMGKVGGADEVFCRVHSACLSGHVFNSIECECQEEMELSQSVISDAGAGLIIYLDQEGKGNGHLALMQSIPFKKAGDPQGVAYEKAGFKADARNYRAAAEILEDLRVMSIVLLSKSEGKADDLRRESIKVNNIRPLTMP